MRSVRRLRISLASQILLFQLAIVLGALLLGAAASYLNESRQLDQRYEQRSLTIAQSVAAMPSVGDGLRDSDPSRTLQPLAEGIRKASGASYVVIECDQRCTQPAHALPVGNYTLMLRVANPMVGGLPVRFANTSQDKDRSAWLIIGQFTFAP